MGPLAGYRLARVFVAALVLATLARSPSQAGDDPPFARRVVADITNTNGDLLQSTTTEDITLSTPSAVQQFGQITIQVNEHFKQLEILDAATIKADGRRIPVPQEKILVSTLPNSASFGIFQADVKVRTIVFPDLAVGDTVHYADRVTEKARPLHGGFDGLWVMPSAARFARADISLDVPEQTQVHRALRGFSEDVAVANGRRRFRWSLEPASFHAEEAGAVAPLDRAPHVVFSSYADPGAFGGLFFKSAAAKSLPTPRIKALADEITKNIPDRQDQARAIFDYVSSNIRYMAIFLGAGGWVPHDADSVLDNKYGDCKDHTTLMRALLAAKSIPADYALINLSPVYKDFEVPTPSLYNHVILYLPEFGAYVDPTASAASFQSLPEGDADKPVLRVHSGGAVAARTPPLSAETNSMSIKADVTLRPDGTPLGSAIIEGRGAMAAQLRSAMAQASLKGPEVFVKERMAAQNWRGAGSIERLVASEHAEPYVVKTSFDLTNRFFGDGENLNAIPVGPALSETPLARFVGFIRNKHTDDFVCGAGTFDVSIDVHLPDKPRLSRMPRNVDVSGALASFESRYTRDGSVLHVVRRFVSKTPGQSCSAETAKSVETIALAAARDFAVRLRFDDENADDAKPSGD